MPMKTWMLEKASFLNDGTQAQWEISMVGGKPELWHDHEKAMEAAARRDFEEFEGCAWRVADDEW